MDSNNPSVSILVPIYGVEKYIERCARSLFEQTYDNIEYIFVDDLTPDNSITILQKIIEDYPNRIVKIIKHAENLGLAGARITGLKNATSDYVIFVDSDDYVEVDMTENLINKAVKDNADIIICSSFSEYQNRTSISSLHVYSDKRELIKDILFKSIPGSMWAKMVKRNIFVIHPDCWPVQGINHGEDYATMPRILHYAEKIVYLNKPLYHYMAFNEGSYTNNFKESSMQSMLRADAILEDFFKNIFDKETIAIMKLRTKSGMIKGGNPTLYPSIGEIYKEEKQYAKLLPIRDRILFDIINKGFNNIIACLIRKYLRK